jgi:2,3-bisphosphoglycerate-independent phosphoglycerate mutase
MTAALPQEKELNSDMSKILCIIDGMADPYFCASDYPNLSSMRLLRHVDTTQGREPESLGCILRLLGIKKIPVHLRGYAEALGNGIPVNKNDLVLRGSWFSLDEQGCCGVPVSAPETLTDIEDCHYYHLEQYKSLLVFPGMASYIADMITYPPHICGGQSARNLCPKGCDIVSRVFNSQLTEHRCLIPWGQSVPVKMAPFPHKAAVICGTPIIKGIAKLLNMTLIPVPGATGDIDTDLVKKSKAALYAAKTYPFVLLHINGADEAAHRKNPEEKRAFLHKVDTIVIKALLQSDWNIYVVSDHGTDPITGQHIGHRQPMFTNVSEKFTQGKPAKSQNHSHLTGI